MERGPQNDKEWEQYSSYNIDRLEKLPMSELYSMGEMLKGIVTQLGEAKDLGEVPEQEENYTNLMIDVSKKRLDIVTVAKFKKIEKMFETPKFK
ncbi:MAG TPA: hypothetical protein VFD35_09325 [Pricia sp.]|nr:hypothetical protein [Pricia sp.]